MDIKCDNRYEIKHRLTNIYAVFQIGRGLPKILPGCPFKKNIGSYFSLTIEKKYQTIKLKLLSNVPFINGMA